MIHSLGSTLMQLWTTVRSFVQTVDRGFIWASQFLGATETRTSRQLGRLLAVYAGIYLLGFIPITLVQLLVFSIGYLGIWSVQRAWVNNEEIRSEIAKALRDENPDSLPDLRVMAVVSALQLVILFPLMFWTLQSRFQLYFVPDEVLAWAWIPFTFDQFCKSLLDWSELYQIDFTRIKPTNVWGQHLIFAKRLTIDLLLIQAIIRVVKIQMSIREVMSALPGDHEMAKRLGRRAVPSLIRLLRNSSWKTRSQAAKALTELRDPRALEPLCEALQDTDAEVVDAAMSALSDYHDPKVVSRLLPLQYDLDANIRSKAIGIVTDLDREQAVKPWCQFLQDNDDWIRGELTPKILGLMKTPEAIPFLTEAWLAADGPLRDKERERIYESLVQTCWDHADRLADYLSDDDEATRALVALLLGELGDVRVVDRLKQVAHDSHPKVRIAAVESLAKLAIEDAATILKDALQDESEQVRKTAIKCAIDLPTPAMVSLLVDVMRDGDGNLREQVVNGWEKEPPSEIVPVLCQALSDPNGDIRLKAAELLAKLNSADSFDPMCKALQDEDPRVVRQALLVLNRLDNPAAAADVRQVLSNPTESFHPIAARIVARWQDQKSLAPLLVLLGAQQLPDVPEDSSFLSRLMDSVARIRNRKTYQGPTAIAESIGKLRNDSAIPTLLELLVSPEANRAGAAQALGLIGNHAVCEPLRKALTDESESVRTESLVALARLGDEAARVSLLDQINSANDDKEKHRLANVLAECNDTRIVPVLCKLRSNLRYKERKRLDQRLKQWNIPAVRLAIEAELRTADGDTARDLMELLRTVGTDESIPCLLQRLDDEDDYTRSSAVRTIADIGGSISSTSLIERFQDVRRDTKLEIVDAIGDKADQRVVNFLNELLASNPDEELRVRAARELRRNPLLELSEQLVRSLRDPNAEVREETVHALSEIKGTTIVPLLTKAATDLDPRVRLAAVDALGKLESQEGRKALVGARNGGESAIQIAAEAALARLGDNQAYTTLTTNILNSIDPVCRRQAVEALRYFPAERVVNFVISRFRDSDANVRRAAISTAKELGDTKFLPHLRRLCHDRDKWTRMDARDVLRGRAK